MFEGFLLIFRVEKHPGRSFFDVYYLSEAKNRAPVSTLAIEKRLNHYLYQSIQDVFKSKTYRTGIRRGQRLAKKQLELDSCSETTNEKKSVS